MMQTIDVVCLPLELSSKSDDFPIYFIFIAPNQKGNCNF